MFFNYVQSCIVLFFLFPFLSYAQEKKQETVNPSLTLPFIANYPLTEDLLLKLEKTEKECKNLPPEPEKENTKSDFTADNDNIEGYVAYISSKQGLVNILRENNFTPKDFVVAFLTFQTTLNGLTEEENST
ncbi:hypothetical protein [Bartonella sp. AU55XJBT]|uniref:hypothetical protein n=1 Tax=Bartonella sp. AU55XJBT TaxID=3019091 RepID=UPI002361976F|nr:hypothetical protein [Bartonella sp. AU55XJBT]